MDEFYGRNMPAPPARVSRATSCRSPSSTRGTRPSPPAATPSRRAPGRRSTSVQWTARQPEARAWYRVPNERLSERVRDRTVADMVAAAEAAGAPVERERRLRHGRRCAPGSRPPWAASRSTPLSRRGRSLRRGRRRRRRDGRRLLLRPGRGARPRDGRGRGGALREPRVRERLHASASRKSCTWWIPRRTSSTPAAADVLARLDLPRRPRRARGLRRADRAAHAAVRGRCRGDAARWRRTAPRRHPRARR